jgi:hypothetical protein
MGNVVDSNGNPVRDSKGNPVRSGSTIDSGSQPNAVSNASLEGAMASVSNFIDPKGFGKSLRDKFIPKNGEGPIKDLKSEPATFKKQADRDWRVRLSVPKVEPYISSPLFNPLVPTNGLVFPYTPTVIVSHSANYNSIAPTHSNYPYFAYQNSQVDQLVITGDFFVQNAGEAQYWVATLHYLRSMTKMFYGGAEETIGSPPPVVKLNGYGDHIFNNVPVIITQFQIDLPQDVDYIQTGIVQQSAGQPEASKAGIDGPAGNTSKSQTSEEKRLATMTGYAPSQSLVTVTVQPLYSRREVEQFSLQKYVNGGYIGSSDKGFI